MGRKIGIYGKLTLLLLVFIMLSACPSSGFCASNVDKFGKTSLHLASSRGEAEIVSLLLENGAEVNVKNKFGWTPLQLAASGGHLEVVRLLLNSGADVTIKNKFGRTALDYAVRNSHVDIVRLLVRD